MLSSQLFWRIFTVYAGLTICAAIAFIVILSHRHKETVFDQVRQRLEEGSRLAEAAIRAADGGEDATREGVVEELRKPSNSTAATSGLRLEILREAAATDANLPSGFLDRVRQTSSAFIDVPSTGANSPAAKVYGREITVKSGETLLILASLPLDAIERDLGQLTSRIWGTAITISMIALAITYLVVGRIIWPLETLTRAVEDLSSGDLPTEVINDSNNEIGRLARSFNSMSTQLSARISDLQLQRKKLAQNNEQLATVLGAMVEGVVAVDEEERILIANEAALEILDLKSSAIVGRPLWESVRIPQVQRVVRDTLTKGGQIRVEFDVPRSQSVVALVVSRLPGDPCPGAVLVFHNVTDLRRLESLRREFVANVSHELKTPLTAISAYTETLLDGAIDDADHNREFLSRIDEHAQRLHALILDLLNLARIESNDNAFEVRPVQVDGVFKASLAGREALAKSKQISLIVRPAGVSLAVLADEEGVRTIIDNLLDNAINYTPSGGSVTVAWRKTDSRLELDVTDTGVGIAREHQSRIFERFYRVDKARSREVGGTGLGLSIVKHLCQMFSGTVGVKSQLGQGSTFRVELPLYVPGRAPGSGILKRGTIVGAEV